MEKKQFDARVDAALTRHSGKNFDQLGEVDKVLVAIWGVEAEVNNGGFHQYYFNSAGDQAVFAPFALNCIGAIHMSEIVAKANAIFGPAGPPKERQERQNLLEDISEHQAQLWDALDDEFYKYPDDIGKLLRSYLENEPTRH